MKYRITSSTLSQCFRICIDARTTGARAARFCKYSATHAVNGRKCALGGGEDRTGMRISSRLRVRGELRLVRLRPMPLIIFLSRLGDTVLDFHVGVKDAYILYPYHRSNAWIGFSTLIFLILISSLGSIVLTFNLNLHSMYRISKSMNSASLLRSVVSTLLSLVSCYGFDIPSNGMTLSLVNR